MLNFIHLHEIYMKLVIRSNFSRCLLSLILLLVLFFRLVFFFSVVILCFVDNNNNLRVIIIATCCRCKKVTVHCLLMACNWFDFSYWMASKFYFLVRDSWHIWFSLFLFHSTNYKRPVGLESVHGKQIADTRQITYFRNIENIFLCTTRTRCSSAQWKREHIIPHHTLIYRTYIVHIRSDMCT